MENASSTLLSSYIGLSFSVFLAILPRSTLSHVFSLQSRNRILSLKLFHTEEQLRQIRSRRKEDSKANARVVEIFASHRHTWQQEEKRLLNQIDAAADEIAALRSQIADMERSEAHLRCTVERLQRDLSERDEMLDFMSRRAAPDEREEEEEEEELRKKDAEEEVLGADEDVDGDCGDDYSRMGRIRVPDGIDPASDTSFVGRMDDLEEMMMLYCRENGLNQNSLPPSEISKRWMECPNGGWQDRQYDDSQESAAYLVRHLVGRREYPWKVSSDGAGVSSRLRLVEQELSSLEKAEKSELSKLSSAWRKQAKRYRSLAGKIDELCRKMRASEECEQSGRGEESRTRRQTEFLVEAFRMQQRAAEVRQRLGEALQEQGGLLVAWGDGDGGAAKLAARRSLDSARINLKEIQRSVEVWLARIMGDLEGLLARDANSPVRDYYLSRYPFVAVT